MAQGRHAAAGHAQKRLPAPRTGEGGKREKKRERFEVFALLPLLLLLRFWVQGSILAVQNSCNAENSKNGSSSYGSSI
ncbi:Hypothetical predicted protein [Podarcis lilfordi]|uniref:Uncharacterized protein n=1 Tax=Podarcis lilfordi TaxID=74358 RepID=A0AA35PN00_9SAUR|nr:Hypothetical predicted protein [Podarcis lilfordi]